MFVKRNETNLGGPNGDTALLQKTPHSDLASAYARSGLDFGSAGSHLLLFSDTLLLQ